MSQPTFATRANLDLLEEYYQRWLKDPSAVDSAWQAFFERFELGSGEGHESTAQTRVVRMIRAHRDLGHIIAHLDPLSDPPATFDQLELSFFGLTEGDLDKVFDGSAFLGLGQATLREIRAACRDTYCRTIG